MKGNQPSPPLLGTMLVERGLVTEDELAHALSVQEETGSTLGDVVKDLALVSPSELSDLLAVQRAWRPLGRMLVEQGLLGEEQLAACLEEGERTGRRLGDVIRARGVVSTTALDRVLAEQHRIEVELERGFGAGLREEIERRHRLKRGQGVEDAKPERRDADDRQQPHSTLSSRLDVTVNREDNDRIAALQQRLDDRENTLESLGTALQRKAEELGRLRIELSERDAIIGALRRRLGETEAATVHQLREADQHAAG